MTAITQPLAVIVQPDGTIEQIEWPKPDNYRAQYRILRAAVEGHYERVRLHDPERSMWVNEDGHRLGLAPNPIATALYWQARTFEPNAPVVGTVVITGADNEEGDVTGLTYEQLTNTLDELAGERLALFLSLVSVEGVIHLPRPHGKTDHNRLGSNA